MVFIRRIRAQFSDSFRELRDVRALTASAMFLAVAVILGFYRLQLTEYIRIGFDFIAKEMTGMFFGPVVGCAVGGLSDLISYMIKPVGGYFPGFTVSAMLGGLIYGLLLYKRPVSLLRIIAANSVVTVFVNLLLNTYWLVFLYGDAFFALLPARAFKQFLMLPIEVMLFYITATMLSKAKLPGVIRNRER